MPEFATPEGRLIHTLRQDVYNMANAARRLLKETEGSTGSEAGAEAWEELDRLVNPHKYKHAPVTVSAETPLPDLNNLIQAVGGEPVPNAL